MCIHSTISNHEKAFYTKNSFIVEDSTKTKLSIDDKHSLH